MRSYFYTSPSGRIPFSSSIHHHDTPRPLAPPPHHPRPPNPLFLLFPSFPSPPPTSVQTRTTSSSSAAAAAALSSLAAVKGTRPPTVNELTACTLRLRRRDCLLTNNDYFFQRRGGGHAQFSQCSKLPARPRMCILAGAGWVAGLRGRGVGGGKM